jgi:uncharacterized protein (TIGR03083 family)
MKQSEPIYTAHLLPKLDNALIALLRSLAAEDWDKPTIAPLWNVKDVAAHLLDTNLRSISMIRDGYFGETPGEIHSYRDLVNFLNRLNADWVKAMKRVSPEVLITLLESTGKEYAALMASLDPFATAAFSVAWAGEEVSFNWFHVAREYTEKWHHQQQIRLAVEKEAALYQHDLYYPHMDTSMRALPHHYRYVSAPDNTIIAVEVSGLGIWYVCRQNQRWVLAKEIEAKYDCTITIPSNIAWRLFTKGISRQDAENVVTITGNRTLGIHILTMLAVMA